MFGFLKDKIKGAISKLSKNIDEKGKEEVKEEIKEIKEEEVEEKKGFFTKLKERFTGPKESEEEIEEKEPEKEEVEEVPKEKREEKKEIKQEKKEKRKEVKEEIKEKPEEKKGFFERIKEKIVTKKIDEKQFDELFWDLEIVLLENNVAVEVIEKIKDDLKQKLVDQPLKRGEIENIILKSLRQAIEDLFNVEKIDFIEKVSEKKPFVICFFGINGSGKTTTIAKIAKMLKDNKLSCVMAAADTFRAAAIDQLQKHADNLNIKLIKHDYGSDAAAVAFDAVKHAKAKNIDVVLIDTAGRMHSNVNLMDEMKKIIRVAAPDLKIFVGESITGNDCTEQAKKFNELVGIDGIILSKADVDEKGGAAISVSYVTGKPIIFIGTGQEYSDLKEFSPELILKSLDL
jgi:fused signal recognition particle receptor